MIRYIIQYINCGSRTFNWVFLGRSGVGKTETALQLFRTFQERKLIDRTITDEYIEGKFFCDSLQSLLQSLSTFSQQNDLGLQTLTNQENTDADKIGGIINEMFEKLKERFPLKIKCLMFDDGEEETGIIRHINDYICKPIAGADPAQNLHDRWKVVVTTQVEECRRWVTGCDYIDDKNFYPIEVFSLDEAKNYFSNVNKMTVDHVRRVHDRLDGLPLALKIAREYLLENRVCLSSTVWKDYHDCKLTVM